MVKIDTELDLFIIRLRGAGGIVQEEDGHVIVQGLKLGSDDKGQYLYLAGNTIRLREKGIVAIEEDDGIHLY